MAYENIDRDAVVTVRYTGTNLTAADNNMGQVVRITGGTAGDNNWARPTVDKLPAGSGSTDGDLYGVVQTVETPSGQSRAPSGERVASVATRGILKTKKTVPPALTDIGLAIGVDSAGTKDNGGVTTAAATSDNSRGIVVGITGTGADDFLLVDWR